MGITKRDIFFSIFFHVGLLVILTVLNPFNVISRSDFDSVQVNLVSIPPLGSPDLIPEVSKPKISIPEALVEEEEAIPIEVPESHEKPKTIDKPKKKSQPKTTKPKKNKGYQGKPKTGKTSQQGGTDVSGQLGPGSKFGSVNVDNANFNYPTYFLRAFGKIERNWSNPVHSNRKLSCKIHFLIIRSGTILEPKVTTSSGFDAYDRACLRALQASTPLPPLPSEFEDDIIGITLEFPYTPR